MDSESVPITLTESDFDEFVAGSGVPVIVDFWRERCSFCDQIEPILERLSTEFAGRVRFAKINTSQSGLLADRYNIRGVPTVIAFTGGERKVSLPGGLKESVYRELVNGLLSDTETDPLVDKILKDDMAWNDFCSAAPVNDLRSVLDRRPDLVTRRLVDGALPIQWAIRYAEPQRLELLASYEQKLGLREFAALGDVAHLKSELSKDPGSIHGVDSDGQTALTLAIGRLMHMKSPTDGRIGGTDDLTRCIRTLIEHGIDVNHIPELNGKQLMPPVAMAVYAEHLELLRLLADSGADLSWRGGPDNGTVLHMAVTASSTEVIRLLLDLGMSQDAKNAQGKTPLEAAEGQLSQWPPDESILRILSTSQLQEAEAINARRRSIIAQVRSLLIER